MAKKMTAKEMREAMKANSSAAKGMAATKQKQEDEKKKKAEEAEAAAKKAEADKLAKVLETVPRKNELSVKKTAVKAAGLKSTFHVKEKIIMTSFGKGNNAIVEKSIEADTVEDINRSKPAFNVTAPAATPKLLVEGLRMKKAKAVADRPVEARMDLPRLKPMLEKQYFGREFPDDNIHIQLAYNVLDIIKILTVHSNNIVYELNNLLRNEGGDNSDFIGYLSTRNSYDYWLGFTEKEVNGRQKNLWQKQSFERLLAQPQLGYFGKAFYKPATKKKKKQDENGQVRQDKDKMPEFERKDEREIYAILALLGTLRQVCTHASANMKGARGVDWLFCLDDKTSMTDEVRAVLNGIYEDAVRGVNKDFISNNKKTNFAILKLMYPHDDRAACLQEFFDFIVRKSFKNLGFSIRTLRETILASGDPLAEQIKSKEYDSMRSKLYQLFDFTLARYYGKHGDRITDLVDALRASSSEDEKLMVYYAESKRVWDAVKATVRIAVDNMSGEKLKELEDASKHDETNYDLYFPADGKLSAETPTFCKLMYLVTMLLDGKEINDLLTTLINKFENIASFYDTMGDLNLDRGFAPGYEMLADSWKIADGLRLINSFCRMQKPLPSAKKVMYREAVEILGMKDALGEEEIERLMNKILCVEIENGKSRKVPGEKGFRNFLANNVIESSRFRYLIRYSNPEKVRHLAENRPLILFQLRRLPETQINSYYELCVGPDDLPLDKKIAALADIIHGIDYTDFESVKQDTRKATREEIADKDRKRNIISLYLTMLYLVVKNLVYVNSRYVMAFEAVVRDTSLHGLNRSPEGQVIPEDGIKSDTKNGIKGCDYDYTVLTQKSIDEQWLKKHPRTYMQEDMAKLADDRQLIRFFRNKAAHLNVVQSAYKYVPEMGMVDSYYGIYHYVLQRMLLDDVKNLTVIEQGWKDALLKYHSYNKDMVKALCVPFGYNLARFKSLTICNLFDRNEQPESKPSPAEAQTT